MSDISFIASFIPDNAYKVIVLGLIAILIFRNKIPILNKIDVRFHFPEEFMRSFRWITPVLCLVTIGIQIIILFYMREIFHLLKVGG